MVTEGFGNACATSKSPFINDCDFDAAGALLAHLYGPLKPARDGRRPDPSASTRPPFDPDAERARACPRGLPVRPGRLRRRRALPAARRLPWLPAVGRRDRPGLRRWRRLQPLGRRQPHRRPLSAGRPAPLPLPRHRPPALAQPARLLGLVGLHRLRFPRQERRPDPRHRRHDRDPGRGNAGSPGAAGPGRSASERDARCGLRPLTSCASGCSWSRGRFAAGRRVRRRTAP